MIKSLLIICGLIFIQSSFAAEVTIEDTSGIVRHVSEVQSPASIKFTLTDAEGNSLDGARVTLTLKDSTETYQAVSTGGVVEFSDIPAGTWIVSTESSDILFTEVIVTEMAGTVAEVGGGTIVAASGDAATTSAVTTTAVSTAGGTAGFSSAALIGGGALAAGGITGLAVAIDQSNSNTKTELSPAS